MRKSQSEGTLEDLMSSLDDLFPFAGLETEYLQHKFFKDYFHHVVSTEKPDCLKAGVHNRRKRVL